MTQRVRDRLALSLIADGAAMAAASNHDLPPLSLLGTTTVAALTDIGTWGQMNEVWDAWVAPGNTPARATVEAKLANPALKVEIMIQAAK